MPRKNKKNKRQQMEEEEEDWDQSGSDEPERISSKDILNMNKKNKNKKNKNKNKTKNQNKNNENGNNNNENDDSDNNNDSMPGKKLSKKELRKLKKMQKYEQQAAKSDSEPQDSADDEFEVPKKKGNKNKKKQNKNQNQHQPNNEDEEADHTSNKKQNKKNKKKGKKKEDRASRLLRLKEERQQGLCALGEEILGDLDVKYEPFISEDVDELWKDTILEAVEFYEASDYEDKVEDDDLFADRKRELRSAWQDIFALIEQDYNQAEEEKANDRKEAERNKKLEELRAQGLNVGGGGGANNMSEAQRKARQKKREEKEKLKALRAHLKEMDRLALEKEKKEAEEKAQQEKVRKEEEAKRKQEAKKKAQEAKRKQMSGWSSSSDDEDSEEDVGKKKKKRKRNNNKKKASPPAKQVASQPSNGKKNKKSALADNSDSDDDEWEAESKAKTKAKEQPKPKKKAKNAMLADSDEEEEQGFAPPKSRGGRNKNNKNKNNKPKPQNGNQTNGANTKKPETKEETKEELKQQPPSPEDDGEEDDEDQEEVSSKKKNGKKNKHKQKGKDKTKNNHANNNKKDKKSKAPLRSPICVVMGHVDTGKTKILDHIRSTSVQDKEAGGITQQIGATYLSIDYIKERTARLQEQVAKLKYKVPGLLFIDTPGHEAFSNLRSRGSSMCDIAILVVDLMHGLEQQTIESLKMLQSRKTPFVVALNKIDMCYDWKADKNAPFLSTYDKQAKHTKRDFDNRLAEAKQAFAEQGINAELYTKNKRIKQDISLVPTSAHTGEGIPDLLYLIVQLTKRYMESSIKFNASNTKASVLEVKQTQGYGATIDVIVSDGTLRSDDTIVVCGMTGPIVSPIRALLQPHEAQEMRVKGEYTQVKEVAASVGVRIAAVEDLSGAVAGAPLFIVPRSLKPQKKANQRRAVIEDLKDEVQKSFANLMSAVDKRGRGVFVQASTLGSLEALIRFLTEQKIPISGIGIGTISKKTIMRAAVMLNFQAEFAVILAFNVQVAPDARVLSEQQGVRIFEADIIYHLQDMFERYMTDLKQARKEAAKDVAVFPVEMKILGAEHVYNNKNPLVLGVQITRGSLRLNTPIVAQRWNASGVGVPIFLGRVDGIKSDNRDVSMAKMGDKVSVRIMGDEAQKNIQVGRSFAVTDPLISEISRDSIDALKANFKEDMTADSDTVQHLGLLKQYFNII